MTGTESLSLIRFRLAFLRCFAVKLRTIFKTRNVFPSFIKDRLSYQSKNSVIYQFKCRCDSVYIGRTGLRLETRVSQHVPSHQRNPEHRNRVSQSVQESAIGQHLMDNQDCASAYKDTWFSVLHSVQTEFHLRVLEAVYLKLHRPNLCRQKDHFTRSLKILKGL